MDKKNLIIGIVCLAAAFGFMFMSMNDQRRMEQYRRDHPEIFPPKDASGNISGNATSANTTTTPAPTFPVVAANATAGNATAANVPANNDAAATAAATSVGNVQVPTATAVAPGAVYELANDDIIVTLTEDGGAIKSITLKKFLAKQGQTDPLVFNAGAPLPMLALALPKPPAANQAQTSYWTWSGSSATAATGNPGVPPALLSMHLDLDKAASNTTTATFRGTVQPGLEIVRKYSLGENSYVIDHSTTLSNNGAAPVSLERVFVTIGTAPPTPGAGAIAMQSLNFGYYNGEAAKFITVDEFKDRPAGLFGLISARPRRDFIFADRPGEPDLRWVSVKDQFFAAVLTPKNILGRGFFVQGVDLTVDGVSETTVSGDLELNLGVLAPGKDKTAEFSYYVGPKDYVRLDRLGQRQDLVMEFGFFGGISKILLLAIIGLHKLIVHVSPTWAWGWAIVIFTAFIKLATWPLTAAQVRSGKKMAEIKEPLNALKEKYKDNPQKLNTETMELFRKNKINPVAGCLPLLIYIPIFISFYYMLRTASELRFAHFLWIYDLAKPDTIGHIAGFAINPLPVLMAITTQVQMHMTPMPSVDPMQRNIMRLMPLILFFSFYSLPSGMILYWTCQNLFTILQQVVTKPKKDTAPAVAHAGHKHAAKKK